VNLTCKEASRLISDGLDRELPLAQRVALRIHIGICTACTRLNSQFEFLRRAASQFPGPDDDLPPPPK
jgi:hypothetical protein